MRMYKIYAHIYTLTLLIFIITQNKLIYKNMFLEI